MPEIEFVNIEGDHESIVKLLADKTDLVIEGGSGAGDEPYQYLRSAGYEGPFIAMDLRIPNKVSEDWYRDGRENERDRQVWNVGGNCLVTEDIEPIIKKFSSKNPIFTSYAAIRPFFSDRFGWTRIKPKRDLISPEEAAKNLSKIFDVQLHWFPAIPCHIASVCYKEESLDKSKKLENPFKGIDVYYQWKEDGDGLDKLRPFQNFVEAHYNNGWKFLTPKGTHSLILMTKGKTEIYQKLVG